MRNPMNAVCGLGGTFVLAASVLAGPDLSGAYITSLDQSRAAADFTRANPGAAFYEVNGRTTVYGNAFAHGADPIDVAEQFVDDNAAMFGVFAEDLALGRLQGLMYNRDTNTYKLTGVDYTQEHDGIPVFRSRLTLLVRNEAGFPMVLARADLRNLGAFDAEIDAVPANDGLAFRSAQRQLGAGAVFGDSRLVIWAGLEGAVVEPRLAHEFEAVVGSAFEPDTYERWLYLVDAHNGNILLQENRVLDTDVVGNTSGLVTQGIAADICDDEELEGIPYMTVSIQGGNTADADANGDFVIANAGDAPVTVESGIEGTWFRVNNEAGADTVLDMTIDPADPANFVHNEANNNEFIRAEINGYLHANIIRDFILNVNPTFAEGALQQTSFPVNVNINSSCNAFYDFSSINFYRSGGGCPNTANSTVVYHEYGHHLVAVAGSGQGEYGEGMGDVVGILITDDSRLALGFFGNCDSPLRDADNNCQYQQAGCSSCGAAIHDCGKLLSGAVWSTRNELLATNPDTYREILSDLTVNSILEHGAGTSITPEITIDFLTLDDDDMNIFNGTPHYNEIAAGFGDHGLDAPDLQLIEFNYPNGLPDSVSPAGGTTVRVEVTALIEDPAPGTGVFHVDTGGGFVDIPMDEVEPNVYDAVFPASDCASEVVYFFTAEAANGQEQQSPSGGAFSTPSAVQVAFNDNFQQDLGWSVSGNASTGQWERATPVDCDRGDPPTDADGSGNAYLTENDTNDCDSDVDGGSTTLTSPIMDASQGMPVITYYRWYSNTFGNDPLNDIFVVEVSDDGGDSWVELETVGPAGNEVDGGWFRKEFNVADFVDLTDEFQIRFTASDLNDGSVVEAGVDGVVLLDCEGVIGDIDGDGIVGTGDLLLLLGAWGPCDDCGNCAADLDGDCNVGTGDLLLLLGNWG